jgi:hypothetical protein
VRTSRSATSTPWNPSEPEALITAARRQLEGAARMRQVRSFRSTL